MLKYTEKLAHLIVIGIYVAVAVIALKYFGNVVGYLVLSLVVSLIARPLVFLMRKVKVRGKAAPDWLLAIVALVVIFGIIGGVIAGLVPVIKKVATNITAISSGSGVNSISGYLADLNMNLRETFRQGPDFKIEVLVLEKLSSLFNMNLFGSMIGSVASTFAGIGVGLFSVIFISFFLIKDDTIVRKLTSALAPERHIQRVLATQSEVERLLSRYFVGLVIEMSIVGFIDFIGLWLVARLDFESALGIGFLAGVLNIIPYLGPVIGGVTGALMGLVIKFCSTGAVGIDVGFWMFVLVLAIIFMTAQLVDNFVLQPLIYSTSIQASPLEIFIVMLLAGAIGGIVGMLLAIPAYTVIRVIAFNFLPDAKVIKMLSGDNSKR